MASWLHASPLHVSRSRRVSQPCAPCNGSGTEPGPAIPREAEVLHAEHHPGTFVPTLASCTEHERADYEAMIKAQHEPPQRP